MADLPSTGCNIANNFYGHNIIFDVEYLAQFLVTKSNTTVSVGTGLAPLTIHLVARERVPTMFTTTPATSGIPGLELPA